MSQQEDDLRALAKIMDFLRAVSIILVVMNVYWFCYEAIRLWGVDIGVVDRILMNFNRTAGLFHSILYTKLFAVLLLALSCLGTKGVKGEKITWGRIWTALAAGFVLFFLNWWILALPLPVEAVTGLYALTVGTGYVCLLMGGLWMSRLLKHNLMDDVFNNENESFMQETRLIESEYSVNLPTRFYYRKRWNNGWINVVNPFRASIVLGTPGSGKSYAVVNSFIKQQIEKGFSMYVYDFKFSDLSTIAYNHLLNHPEGYKVKPKFYVINFDDPRRSHRCNPIHPDFMEDITDAYESAYTIMLNLNKSWVQKQGDFFVESPIILFAAITSIIGAAYTSVSFLKTLHPFIMENEKWFVIGFIAVSTVIMTLLGQPATLLVLAGSVNGLILPITLLVILLASRRKDIVGENYKHPTVLIVLGVCVVLLTGYSGIKALPKILTIFG